MLMETFKTIGTVLVTNEVFGKGLDIGKDQIRKNSMGDWASGGTKQNLSSSLLNFGEKEPSSESGTSSIVLSYELIRIPYFLFIILSCKIMRKLQGA